MSDTPAGQGHNVGGIAGEQLRGIIERVERLNDEIKGLNDDKAAIFAEAKAHGFDTKIVKEIIRLRAQDKADRQEHDALLDLYKRALGMLD